MLCSSVSLLFQGLEDFSRIEPFPLWRAHAARVNWYVIELGCGTAAVGLACAALSCSEVVLTDVDEAALLLAQRNAVLNGLVCARTAILNIEQPIL